MVQARVLQVDKRKITLDTGVKIAKIAAADITPECILSKVPGGGSRTRGTNTIDDHLARL
jgi:hypothetical protein